MEHVRRMSREQLRQIRINNLLSKVLTFNVRLIVLLMIIIFLIYIYSIIIVKYDKLTISKDKYINSIKSTDISTLYKLDDIDFENDNVNKIMIERIKNILSERINQNDIELSKISKVGNVYVISYLCIQNQVNKNVNSYITKLNLIHKGKEEHINEILNYNHIFGKEIKIENIIKKDKKEEFQNLIKEKYNLNRADINKFVLYKENFEIYSDDFESKVTIKYDDIEEYLEGQALTNENVTNYYTLFKNVIDPDKPMLALTFDDGPYGPSTERILKTLTKYNSKATFFVLGTRVDAYPDTIRNIIAQGSQIGNHTKNHLNLLQQTEDTIKYEINYVKTRVKEVADYDVTVLRPPYGNRNDIVKQIAACPLILWCVDTLDWKTRNANSVKNEILSSAFDGAIILMHDIYETTADAVEIAIPELINRGYQLVTIDELYYYKGKSKVSGEVVYSIK